MRAERSELASGANNTPHIVQNNLKLLLDNVLLTLYIKVMKLAQLSLVALVFSFLFVGGVRAEEIGDGDVFSPEVEVNVIAIIGDEVGSTPLFGGVSVSWSTDSLTNARVVYDTVSHPVLDVGDVNYGYAFSTPLFDLDKTFDHETTLTNLNGQDTYYYRTVSEPEPPVIIEEPIEPEPEDNDCGRYRACERVSRNFKRWKSKTAERRNRFTIKFGDEDATSGGEFVVPSFKPDLDCSQLNRNPVGRIFKRKSNHHRFWF